MICSSIQKRLSAYIDRQLPISEKNAVGQHLAECSSCRADLRSLLEVKQALRASPQPPMPVDLRAAIEAATITKSTFWDSLFSIPWWVPSIAFVVAGGWMLLHFYNTHSPIITPQHLEAHQTPSSGALQSLVAMHPENSRSKDTQ